MLTIVTWNVNSIKSRLEHTVRFLREQSPDIVLLQELKCTDDAFPFLEIEALGYNIVTHGQKTYNGVAILSKYPIDSDDVVRGLPGDDSDEAARYIEAVISLEGQAIRVASVYVPNGQSPDSDKFSYKMRFFDRLYAHARRLLSYRELLVLGGDYNVAPTDLDVYDPISLRHSICFHPDEQQHFRSLEYLGLTDAYRALHPDTQQFSWWDYRGSGWQYNKGMRIDHLLLSALAADRLKSAHVSTDVRNWEKPSDHAPVMCSLQLT